MTLRLALLLVSLIIVGVIGLLCHQKYQRIKGKKRPSELAAEIDADAELEEQVNTPFFTENVVSDIPDEVSSVLQPAQVQLEEDSKSLELTTSLEELMDQEKIVQQLAQQMLPQYAEDEFITEYVAVFPNVHQTAKQINKVIMLLQNDVDRTVEIQAAVKDRFDFVPLSTIKDKHKIRHLKTILQLKDKKGVIDENVLKNYQQFVEKSAAQFGCEYRYALTADQAVDVRNTLDELVKDNDLIIILYILAQPDDSFAGEKLLTAVTAAGLEHGEFDFFHFVSSSDTNHGNKVYSLANMYKPGTFDLEILDNFSTMGLCAFMVPALLNDPVSAFREMCTSCKQVADQLNGVLTTNQRELLSEDNYISICNQITAHKDKLNSAGVDSGSELAKQLFA